MSEKREASGRVWGRTALAPAAPLASALCLFLVIGAGVYGLERLKDYVRALPEQDPEIKVELVVPPDAAWVDAEGWRPRILSAVQVPEGQAWADEHLLQDIGDQMNRSGWVSSVEAVTREMDGTIRIVCAYRRPVAMVLAENVYLPVDRDGYRLPEVYARVSDSGWMRIVGVEVEPASPLPKIGEPFTGDDALAGIRLASLIFPQRFAPMVGAIDVRNFRGRQDPRHGHLLVWPRRGQPFVWGSAVGEEIEEATVEDKLRKIAKQFESGWPRARIDVSVYPNASIERTSGVIRTGDGSGGEVR